MGSEALTQERDLQAECDEISATRQKVEQAISQAESEIVRLEKKLAEAEQTQAESDALAALGEQAGTKKPFDTGVIQAEIKRQRAMILALRKKIRELEVAAVEAEIGLLSRDRQEWSAKVRERFEEVQRLTKEVAEADRARFVAIGQVDGCSAKIRELTMKLHALRQG